MTLSSLLQSLDAANERFLGKLQARITPSPEDLPTIREAPILSTKERKKIYQGQEGFMMHGMDSGRMSTLLQDFDGTCTWVPFLCREKGLDYDEFSSQLAEKYHCSSGGYDRLIVQRDSSTLKDGFFHRDAEELKTQGFRWCGMGWIDFSRMLKIKHGPKVYSKMFDHFAVIHAQPRPTTWAERQSKIDDVMNKLWCYMAWTKRAE